MMYRTDLIPVFAIWRNLPDLAVEAVGVRGYEDLGHQRGETCSEESLGRGDSHGTHCAPMKGPLHHEVQRFSMGS